MSAAAREAADAVDGLVSPPGAVDASPAIDVGLADRLVARIVSTSGRTVTSYAPFTGQPLATLPQSSVEDVAEAALRARTIQLPWAATPLRERASLMLRLHDVVLDRQSEIMDLVQWEAGKVRKHAYDEAAHVALTARYYARTASSHLAPSRRVGLMPGLTRVHVNRVPKGLVGVISPWNYPFSMAMADGLPALLAGNTVLHKPDAHTMLSALLGAELLEDAGFPADVWQIVAGPGPVVGAEIVEQADYVCFTGSTATGRLIARRAADRLIGCSLELGGKNPMLILRDADLDRAADGAVRACFSSAGQLCVSMERLYVADSIYDRFLERFVRRIKALKLSNEIGFDGDMGSLVSADQLATVTQHVADAVAKGATVVTGGRTRPDVGPLFYEPTVLTNVTSGMVCFETETFGPVVSLSRFSTEAEAVTLANSGEFGLNASVYSRDVRRALALAGQIRAGSVNVNEAFAATFGSIDAPMGGMRQSGLGRRQGAEGIHRFVETQSVAAQRVLPFAPFWGMSDQQYVAAMNAQLRVLRRIRRR
jgi:succinate-semialdehyde dehydrogenase / glutarate-semialdehyde dehydrogenase